MNGLSRELIKRLTTWLIHQLSNTRGDRAEAIEAEKAERAEVLHDIDDNDETGKLTTEKDSCGKGPGIV